MRTEPDQVTITLEMANFEPRRERVAAPRRPPLKIARCRFYSDPATSSDRSSFRPRRYQHRRPTSHVAVCSLPEVALSFTQPSIAACEALHLFFSSTRPSRFEAGRTRLVSRRIQARGTQPRPNADLIHGLSIKLSASRRSQGKTEQRRRKDTVPAQWSETVGKVSRGNSAEIPTPMLYRLTSLRSEPLVSVHFSRLVFFHNRLPGGRRESTVGDSEARARAEPVSRGLPESS